MGKKIAIAIAILILAGAIVFTVLEIKDKNPTEFSPTGAEEFSLLEYQSKINEFPSDKIVKKITDVKTAKEQAEIVWLEIYGEEVKDEKPYNVYYDKNNNVWLVNGTLPPDCLGGVAYIIIQTDGKVLAVWHEE